VRKSLLVAGFAGLGLVAGSPVCVAGGVVSHAPIRHLPELAGAMTVISGAGLLSQVIERGKAGSCGFAIPELAVAGPRDHRHQVLAGRRRRGLAYLR